MVVAYTAIAIGSTWEIVLPYPSLNHNVGTDYNNVVELWFNVQTATCEILTGSFRSKDYTECYITIQYIKTTD